ncbi:MAG: AMP-binding protein [Alphaproteobacteria bacterium]|nr:AMP-binding protein [Alphaproteobacteria bacterium]
MAQGLITDFLARSAVAAPAAPALSDGAGTWSYGAFADGVAGSAEWLAGLGVGAGDRVLIVGENGHTLVALLFAAFALGAWAVPVNARLTAREIAAIAAHSGAVRTVFALDASPAAAAHARAAGAAPVPAPCGLVAVTPAVASLREPRTPGDAVAALIYTSGTTGSPKGVMLSHRALRFIAETTVVRRALSAADHVYAVLPITHIFGLSNMLLGTVAAGGRLSLEPRFDPARALAAFAAGVTVFQGVPAMFARLVEHVGATVRRPAAPALRLLSAGGSPLDPALAARVEDAFGLPLLNGYGLTEAGPTVSNTPPDRPRRDGSVGWPIPGVELRVVDPVQGSDVPAGAVGELWVRSPAVMLGYYRDAAATAATMVAGGWLRTGDLARIAGDGAVFIAGRIKELIIRSGFNVYPPEVEAVLAAHPDVTQAAVVGRAAGGDEQVIAFVELRPGAAATPATLAAFARERLAPYKRPQAIIVLDRLPASPTGKVLKGALRERAAAMETLPG